MKIYAHRGNLVGRAPEFENSPEYIKKALSHGFGAEVDYWWFPKPDGGPHILCHDHPFSNVNPDKAGEYQEPKQYHIDPQFLLTPGLAVHCKNIHALEYCKKLGVETYFSHDKDDAVLTSDGYFWTYPKAVLPLNNQSIPVVFDRHDSIWPIHRLKTCAGLCTDDCFYYASLLEEDFIV